MCRTNGIVAAVLLFSLGGIAQLPAVQMSPPAASEGSQSTQPPAGEPALKAMRESQPLQPTPEQKNSVGEAAPTTIDRSWTALLGENASL